MNKENDLILELCKGDYANIDVLNELMEEKLDYSYILGQLLYNRVGTIAYTALKKNELLHRVNREFRNTLKTVYEHNSIKTDSFINALNLLKSVCTKLQFPYAFLKGAYLVQLYDRGLRTSNDIDILINPQHITELTDKLKMMGFKQGYVRNEEFAPASRTEIISSRMNRGEIVPLVKEVNLPGMKYLEIDINFSLGFRPGVDEEIVQTFLKRTQPLILNTISTLDQTDFLMHLCAHLYKEATVLSWVELDRDVSLYKYCDIYLFLHKFMNAEFAATLIQKINDLGLNKECYFALSYAKQLFGISSDNLNKVLTVIKPVDSSFMTQVLEPQTGKVYSYDMGYRDWVFCSDRKGKLYETGNVE